jgi:hypothetical protein
MHSETIDVERRGEVHGRTHGAEAVNAMKVIMDANARRVLAIELACDGVVLQIKGLGVLANDNVWFRLTERWRWEGVDGLFSKVYAVNGLGTTSPAAGGS